MAKKTDMKVLFVANGEPMASSRYRAGQYFNRMQQDQKLKHEVAYFEVAPQKYFKQHRLLYLVGILLKRIYSLIVATRYDIIFLQKYPAKVLSPYYEIILKKVLRKKLIFDFDDAIWLEGAWRVDTIISLADKVIVGNSYLAEYARRINNNVEIIPTVIEERKIERIPSRSANDTVSILWTGSRPGNRYLLQMEQIFIEVKNRYGNSLDIKIVSNEVPGFKNFNRYTYYDWTSEVERELLCSSDIGIMPLDDSVISQGKCGFKLLLYGMYEMASIATPVGVNKDIITPGVNGFLPSSQTEWVKYISFLVANRRELLSMKKAAKKTVIDKYTLNSTYANFLNAIYE